MNNILAPLPPGHYDPLVYQPKIRPIDWTLIGWMCRNKEGNILQASNELDVPVTELIESIRYLRNLGVL